MCTCCGLFFINMMKLRKTEDTALSQRLCSESEFIIFFNQDERNMKMKVVCLKLKPSDVKVNMLSTCLFVDAHWQWLKTYGLWQFSTWAFRLQSLDNLGIMIGRPTFVNLHSSIQEGKSQEQKKVCWMIFIYLFLNKQLCC